MQSTASFNQTLQSRTSQSALPFTAGCLALLLLSAGLAAAIPIAFSVATVFLFAGPHNWVELRYFASRLPSRFGPFKAFFLSSFAGVGFLGLSYATLVFLARTSFFSGETATMIFQGWLLAFHAWLASLILSRTKAGSYRKIAALAALAASTVFAWLQPLYFGLALVYLHPLLGLFILDRELQRSKKQWQKPYRSVLLLLPFVITWMLFQLGQSSNLPTDSILNLQITRHAGSYLLSGVSTHLLVSIHVFLEMLHYGVWLLAVPAASLLFQKKNWQPEKLLIARNNAPLQKALTLSFAASTVLVAALWAAFAADYSLTRDLYFTVAVFHILAEIPFLLWML